MLYSQSEKMGIIHLVEESDLPIKRTLYELHVHPKCAQHPYKEALPLFRNLWQGFIRFGLPGF
jgi:hypothetical protein